MTDASRRHLIVFALFTIWLAIVVCASWRHAVWRDEVRALSFALNGRNVIAMLAGLRGEGHPAIWYLLLRGAHALWPQPQAMKVVAVAIAAAAALFFLWRAPFPWPLKALILAGNSFLFEYSVMSRNYGISMLLMFLFAACYSRYRERGLLPGVLLFLLANTNTHSVLLAGGYLLLWLLDIAGSPGGFRKQALRNWAINAAIAVPGIVLCLALTHPAPTNNAVTSLRPATVAVPLAKALFVPGDKLRDLARIPPGTFLPETGDRQLWKALLSVLLFGSVLGLLRRPSAFIAALATLLLFSLFFMFVYPGEHRHQELWLTFLISAYWIEAESPTKSSPFLPASWQPLVARAAKIGSTCFWLLLLLQVPIGIANAFSDIGFGQPVSRSRDFGELIRRRPDLQNAVVIADPDFLLEPLPYYVSNPTYLLREQRFAKVVTFTTEARMELTLDDMIEAARRLRTETGEPVVILLQQPLDSLARPQVYREGYAWELIVTPDQVARFRNATDFLAGLGPARTKESFGVYLLK